MRNYLAGAAGLLLATSGCAALTDDTGADGDRLAVSTGFYPLQYAAERVAGDRAEVTVLTSPGNEPHDLELTIAETAEITSADLVVHEQGFQPAVDDAVAQNADGAVLDAAAVVDLRAVDESEEEHGEEDGHEHADDDTDPHFWLDPLRMATLGDALADELSDLDPDHAEEYRTRAADLRADLEQLDTAYAEGLTGCETTTVVVSHDAFSYLDKYGLDLVGVAGLSPDAEPTPADLGRLQALAREDDVTTIFSERLASPQLTESLANDLGIRTAVLDPIEGLAEDTAEEDYLSLMEQNLAALRTANRCP